MSEIQSLSMADIQALVKQAQEALKARKQARAEEFAPIIRDAVEDVILTHGDPETSEKSGWTGYSERTTVMIDGVAYGVALTITDTKQSEANKAALKKAEEEKKKAAANA